MNKYFAIGGLLAFVLWSGFMYYEGYNKESVLCAKAAEKITIAEQSDTIAAQTGVIAAVEKQQTITQGVDYDYQTKEHAIDSHYSSTGSMQPAITGPASNSMSATAKTPGRLNGATTRQFVTGVFRLNAEECDENTEQVYGLQDWVRKQFAVKTSKH